MGMIEIENLSYCYPHTEIPAIKNINLSIKKGEFVLLVGASGCGKTTMVQCLKGLIPKVVGGTLKGSIKIDGKDISQYHVYQISSKVGMVFQNPDTQLFGLTVEEDVAFGPENLGIPASEILTRVHHSLHAVKMEKLRSRFCFTLSGGEKQRTAIAGNLAMQPVVLILDEPTSDLDPAGTKEVLATIKRLNKEKDLTIILIEHKIDEVVDISDRLIVMDKGEIAEDGKPWEVFCQKKKFLKTIGIYPPQLYEISNMLGLKKPSYESILNSLSKLDGCFFTENKNEHATEQNIVIENLWHAHEDGSAALKNINLRINRGEFVAIIGHNGAGKTTLAGHFIGFLKPQKGRILIEGKDIKKATVAELAQTVGYLFQNPDNQIFTDKVAKEVAFGLKNVELNNIEVRVSDALRMMELTVEKNKHPHALSRGQRQRLAVASILAMEPNILILDEPTTGQDRGHLNKFLKHIKKLNEAGKTILLITHDMKIVAEYAKRTVVMENGGILMDGTTRDVFSKIDVLEKSSIELPTVIKLSHELREKGKKISIILSLAELCEVLKVTLLIKAP